MVKFKPFSNASESWIWLSNNCDICTTKQGCTGLRNLELAEVTGEITMKSAEFIGIRKITTLQNLEGYSRLKVICQHKDKREIKKNIKKQVINNLNLF